MDKRPKRRKDKYNPYTLCSEKGKYCEFSERIGKTVKSR